MTRREIVRWVYHLLRPAPECSLTASDKPRSVNARAGDSTAAERLGGKPVLNECAAFGR